MKQERIQAIKSTLKAVVRHDGEALFFYDTTRGCWNRQTKNLAVMALQKLLVEAKTKKISALDAKLVLADIACDPEFYRPLKEASAHLLNLKNGVLNIDSGEFQNAKPEDDFKFQLDFSYDKEAKITQGTAFLNFLKLAFDLPDEMAPEAVLVHPPVKRLYEFMGYLVSNEIRAKKLLVILGPANSGKSQILELLRRVIGSTVALNLDELSGQTGGRFKTELLTKAHALVNDEMPCKSLKGLSELKKIIAGETITVEAKGLTPKTIKNKAKLLFAGNQLPTLAEPDSGGAFASRLCVVKLRRAPKPEEKDVDLINKLYNERDIIFSLATDAFIRMRSRSLNFTPEPVGDALVDAYSADNASVESFVRESGKVKIGEKASTVELYNLYQEFCTEAALEPVNGLISFRNQLAPLPEVKGFSKKRILGHNVSVVLGLEIVRD